jgi:penicillin-binding protein 1C
VNAGAPEGSPPQIISPLRGSAYVVRLRQQGGEPIALNASADADAHMLYWFVDNAYVGKSAPGDPLYWQPTEAGSFRLRAVNDHGRSDERALDVRLVE